MNTAAIAAIDPYYWDITITWYDGMVDIVNVRRFDGLPFDVEAWQVADHVRAVLAERGIDAGTQLAAFINGGTVCVVHD